MKALTYHGPHHVSVDSVPDPGLEAPDDIILRVTATAICGSDLHLYRGKIPGTHHGDIFGHEFMGEVVETGPEVMAVSKGDRVVIPFVIACGECFFCHLHQYAACENTNSGKGAALNRKNITPPAALFGYSDLYGGIPGGQAEFVRVPKANAGPFKVPDTLPDEKVLFLSDILPTAWQAVKNADIRQGSSVAIFGAGPVGLLCAACARLNGAEHIFIVENNSLSLVARGCAVAAPCRTKVAEQLLEIGVKAGITGAVAKTLADKLTADELDHLVTLEMMGNDEITSNYLSSLQDKYGSGSASSPNIGKDLTEGEKAELGGAGSGTGTPPPPENDPKQQNNKTEQKLNQKQESSIKKIDNLIKNSIKDHDITGTLKDMDSNPIIKPDGSGKYWNHMKEMQDTLNGLRNHANTLKNVNNPEAQAAYGRATDAINKLESAIKGHGI